jgi:hypothetical protein
MAASLQHPERYRKRFDELVFFRFRVVSLSQRSAATLPSFNFAGTKKSCVHLCIYSFVQYKLEPKLFDDAAFYGIEILRVWRGGQGVAPSPCVGLHYSVLKRSSAAAPSASK